MKTDEKTNNMKKIFILVFTSLLFVQCNSVKRHNSHLNDLISVKDLKSDVDFTYKKLKTFIFV